MATIDDMPAHVLTSVITMAAEQRFGREPSKAAALRIGLTSKRWADLAQRVAWRRQLPDDPAWLHASVESVLVLVGQHAQGLRELSVYGLGRLSPLVATSLSQRSLYSLGLTPDDTPDHGRLLRALLDGSTSSTLRVLHVRSRDSTSHVAGIIRGRSLPALQTLSICENEELDPTGYTELQLPSLTTLVAGASFVHALDKWTSIASQITDLTIIGDPGRFGSFRAVRVLSIVHDGPLERAFFLNLPRTLRHLELDCYFPDEELQEWFGNRHRDPRQLEMLVCYGQLATYEPIVTVKRPRWLREACEEREIALRWGVLGPEDLRSDSEDYE